MTASWTPRERRLREALEGVMELAKEWSSAEISFAHPLAGAKERNAAIAAEEALEAHINAALADPPPLDQRDEALSAQDVIDRKYQARAWRDKAVQSNTEAYEARHERDNALEALRLAEEAIVSLVPSHRAVGCYCPVGWDAPAATLHSKQCLTARAALAAIAAAKGDTNAQR